MRTCAEVLDASAVGLLLADDSNNLSVVASTSERSRLVELMQLKAGHGPCVECFTTGEVVTVPEISEVRSEWPQFSEAALEQGFRSVHAVPLRLRGEVLGALNLFRNGPGTITPEDAAAAQGLADVATIGILHKRTLKESGIAQEQLQHALNSRVVIEQAKGVIAHTHGGDMEDAFETLRGYARRNRLPLREVAERVVSRSLKV